MITKNSIASRRFRARLGQAVASLAIGVMTAGVPVAQAASVPAAPVNVQPVVAPAALAQPVADPAPAGTSPIPSLLAQAPGLHPEVLRLALEALTNAASRGLVARRDVLTVIDYSLPSTTPRLFTFDLKSQKLLFSELVAHGKNSGDNETVRFSNDLNSRETSLGLFVTQSTYFGHDGYSLKLQGLDKGFNDLAMTRNIVLHGAAYVSEATAHALGRLGRSFGCPAVAKDVAPKIIDTLKGGTAIFAYYPDPTWLHSSAFLNPTA